MPALPRHRLAIPIILGCLLCLPPCLPDTAQAGGQDVADEIFYHFMPICWRDSDSDAYRFGDFGGMTASLDYLKTLGVTAVWMNPIFPSPAYHGYQHGAADQLNPWFGTEADLVAFLEAAHARGIKIFVDFVAYGISHDSIWFQDAHGNPGSLYDSWLAFTNGANTEYQGSTFTTWNGDTVGFIHWDLRDFNPVALVTQWAQYWLDPDGNGDFSDGLDGYRLDHVWEWYPYGPDGWGYHLSTFWVPWREALRQVNPDVFVFAEQANWGSHGEELLAGMDAAFAKPLEFAARDALIWESADPLYSQMAATVAALASSPDSGNFMCTIGNHDVDRLASAIGDSFEKGKAAAAVLLTQPFPPILYHGDEIGMRGTKNGSYLGDAADIPLREPFKWNAEAGPPMSNYYVLNAEAYANSVSQNHDGRSVEEQLDVPGSLLEAYRELIAARQASIGLRRGDYVAVSNSDYQVWSFVRDHVDQQVLVAINLSGGTQVLALDLSGFTVVGGSTTPADLLSGGTLPAITETNQDAYPLTLGAYGYGIYEVELIAPEPPPSLVDGQAIPGDFGPDALLATQDNATGLGDNVSELNQLFVHRAADSLFVGATGNLGDYDGFALFLDTGPGGQNVLDLTGASPPPYGPENFTGLQFDAGFEPDHLLYINTWNGSLYVDQFELLTGGGIGKTYRGEGTVNDGDGVLAGGSNPNGMQMALDNSNVAGVTDMDPSGAATATSGFEMMLPFADLDLPGEEDVEVGFAAFLNIWTGEASNQWLPGLGGGYANLGLMPDLTQVPDDQHVFVLLLADPLSVAGPAPQETPVENEFVPGQAYPNPSPGGSVFRFNLSRAGAIKVGVYDVAGRLVRELHAGHAEDGPHALRWDGRDGNGRSVPSGIYLYRVEGIGLSEVRRVVVVR